MTSRIWAWGWAKEKYYVQKLGKEIFDHIGLTGDGYKIFSSYLDLPSFQSSLYFPTFVIPWGDHYSWNQKAVKSKYSSEKSVVSSAEREFWELDWNWVPTGISLSCSFHPPSCPLGCYSRGCDSIGQKCDCAFYVSAHVNTPLTSPQCPTWTGAPLREE